MTFDQNIRVIYTGFPVRIETQCAPIRSILRILISFFLSTSLRYLFSSSHGFPVSLHLFLYLIFIQIHWETSRARVLPVRQLPALPLLSTRSFLLSPLFSINSEFYLIRSPPLCIVAPTHTVAKTRIPETPFEYLEKISHVQSV